MEKEANEPMNEGMKNPANDEEESKKAKDEKKSKNEVTKNNGNMLGASLVNLSLLSPEKMHSIALISLVVGVPYLIVGLAQFVLSLTGPHIIPGDPIGGLVLALIGTIFLYGAKDFLNDVTDGISFYYMGIILSLIFSVLFILILIADWAEFLLGNEDFLDWSPWEDVVPGIYLVIFPLLFYVHLRKNGILRLGHTFGGWGL